MSEGGRVVSTVEELASGGGNAFVANSFIVEKAVLIATTTIFTVMQPLSNLRRQNSTS